MTFKVSRLAILFTVASVLGLGLAFILMGPLAAQEQQEKEAPTKAIETPTILQKLKNGSIQFSEADQALRELKIAIKEEPDTYWSSSIDSLASALSQNGDFDKAVSLAHDRYTDRLGKAKSNGELKGLLTCVECIIEHCGKSSRPNLGNEVLDDFIPAFRKEIAESEKPKGYFLGQLAKLVGIRCQSLEKAKAESMLQKELQRSDQFRKQHSDEPQALTPLIEVKKALAVADYPGGKVNMEVVDELSRLVEEAKPKMHKIVWGLLLYETQRHVIQNLMFEHPEKATELMTATIEKLEAAGKGDDSFEAMFDFRVREFKAYSRSIGKYKELRKLVGTRAVEFDSAAWVNGDESTLVDLAGRVVLLDFTAVWCGPCVQLIPELNAMHRDFADKGLTIVSVTDQYDFIWDKEKNAAKKSKTPLDLKNQIELQEGFVAKHKQRFPVMVTEKNSAMFKSYGVGSIPHAVLIDHKGIIQEVITGNTEVGKRRIKRKVQELLADR